MRHLLAMGGGGFLMEPDNLALDRHLLSLSGKTRPKVCFVGTASGDAADCEERFYRSMAELDCAPRHLSLFHPPEGDLRAFVLDQDVFYVGGGNTRNLLVLWKEWGLDRMLAEAWARGAVLGGISAGAICWFEQGLTDSVTGTLQPLTGLGFLRGSACPHYDGEAARRPAYREAVGSGAMLPGIACDDGVAAHFVDGELVSFVSSRPGARAYRVERVDGVVTEEPVEPVLLR
ncbi:MAG: peptidase E [Alphaproteobacteria bacterium]|nr:peptidase E [Alphaproteobacteria bacterium]